MHWPWKSILLQNQVIGLWWHMGLICEYKNFKFFTHVKAYTYFLN